MIPFSFPLCELILTLCFFLVKCLSSLPFHSILQWYVPGYHFFRFMVTNNDPISLRLSRIWTQFPFSMHVLALCDIDSHLRIMILIHARSISVFTSFNLIKMNVYLCIWCVCFYLLSFGLILDFLIMRLFLCTNTHLFEFVWLGLL